MTPDAADPSGIESGIESGQIWDTVVEAVSRLRDIVYDDPLVNTLELKAEGVRYLTQFLSTAAVYELQDPAYPRFTRIFGATLDYGGGNPDCLFRYVRLHGDHTYRVSGRRGSTTIFGLEVSSGDIADVRGAARTPGDFYVLGPPDAEIDIVLGGPERPGNWLPLPPGDSFVQVREIFADWEKETPAELFIERVGATFPPPPVAPPEVADYVGRFHGVLTSLASACRQAAQGFYAADPETVAFQGDWDIGWTQFAYCRAHWACAPDEAVILDVAVPPESPYWVFHLCNHFWQSMDFHFRQTSLNSRQSVLDSDGRFRAVIAHRDPGVPNWLDAAGHPFGLIWARCFGAKPGDLTLRKVPLDRLRDALPADTGTLSAQARQDSLRVRRRSLERRLMD